MEQTSSNDARNASIQIKKAVEAAFKNELQKRGTRYMKIIPMPLRRRDGTLTWITSARLGREYGRRDETVFFQNGTVFCYSIPELQLICNAFGVQPDIQ